MADSKRRKRPIRLSIRTLLLATLGCAMIVAIFRFGASSANSFHVQLVLGFAIPGASLGYDLSPTSYGTACGTCVVACLGTCITSAIVLLIGW